jgi:hypothetical protein
VYTISVLDVLEDNLPDTGLQKYRIYIFRDQNFVFYVGKTEQYIVDRLAEHLGLTYRDASLMGQLVEDNTPLSYAWQIDLLTLDDCLPCVQRHFPNARIDVRLAELATIAEFSPALNSESNPNPHALPTQYTARRDARVRDAYKKVFNDRK